ncbi:MAG: HPr family phosphocarrier protein [Candidatus Omnitrophica bacterium]|nr:HPr family phosphocarrier protein [Candidatus Omnitrophota bacterium]
MIVEKKLIIKHKQGLHARPAAIFVQIANRFECAISVRKNNQEVNGKSIMGILMLAAEKGSHIYIKADGPDAKKAVEELEKLLLGEMEEPEGKIKK